MEIAIIDLSLSEAIETRLKRSEMITIDNVNKADFDAIILRPIYLAELEKYERRIGKKEIAFTKEDKEKFEIMFVNRYYKNEKLNI